MEGRKQGIKDKEGRRIRGRKNERTERRARVGSTPFPYTGGSGFKSRPGDGKSCLRFVVVLLSLSRQCLRKHQPWLLARHLIPLYVLFTYLPTVERYVDSVVKKPSVNNNLTSIDTQVTR
jgi:hypothetical protein